jgi:hypothetical protein
MNATNFIFCLLHIANLLLLVVLTPLHSPCIPSIDCANSFANCVNSSLDYDHTSIDYTNFSNDYSNKFDDCVKTPND